MTTTPPTPPPLDSAAAVRLARLAWPAYDWRPPANHDIPVAVEYLMRDHDFNLDSLDSLAAAEQRVVAAGLGDDYQFEFLLSQLEPLYPEVKCGCCGTGRGGGPQPWHFTTAPAQARARALIQLLDQHPELEQVK